VIAFLDLGTNLGLINLIASLGKFFFAVAEVLIYHCIDLGSTLSFHSTERALEDESIAEIMQRNIWIGIGCQKGTPRELIEMAIAHLCQTYHIPQEAIAGIATLDRKAQETGILEFCRDSNTEHRHLPLRTFTAAQLAAIPTEQPCAIAQTTVGTPSVAEAAAMLAAAPNAQLLVAKQIFRHGDDGGSVTTAIALQSSARSSEPITSP
jgi:cobalamin biosynthesis protein CbiG